MSGHGILVIIKALLAGIVAALTAVLGGWDMLLTALVCMMLADYITGLVAAAIKGELDSKVGLKGAAKKILIFVLVAVAAVVDTATGLTGHPLRAAACLFYIGNEGISIVENLGRAGVPIPSWLGNLFARIKAENDQKNE